MMAQIRNFNFILIITFVWQIQTVELACPYNVPACSCADMTLSCIDLNEMPPLQTGSGVIGITDASFRGGNISSIPDNSLPPGLQILDFQNHPLTNISAGAFNTSANTLQQLMITSAVFTRLPDAIGNLTNLTFLTIQYTCVEDWNNPVLQKIGTTLQTLLLNKVGLTAWPSWFSLFHSLKEVELSQNSIQIVPDDAFNSSKDTLTTLTLGSCNLTQVPKALLVLTNLVSLDLNSNNIARVAGRPGIEQLITFPFAKTLRSLGIKSIGLTEMPNLSGLTNLTSIVLDNNQILDPASASFPPGLNDLYYNNNNLTSVPAAITNLSGLTTLSLSLNQITEVTLDHLPSRLTSLTLSSNKITNITDTFSTNSSLLQTLILDHNPLSSISPSAFRNLNNLISLKLDLTNLNELPLALTSLTKLQTLWISFVNCPTPPPVELVNWFKALGHMSILGKCTDGRDINNYLRDQVQTTTTITQGTQSTTPGGASTLKESVWSILNLLLLLFIASFLQ